MIIDRIVLAIDVGSSSIRCTAFKILIESDEKPGVSNEEQPSLIRAVPDCSFSKKMQCVHPNSGRINLFSQNSSSKRTTLLEEIDSSVDATLAKLRGQYNCDNSLSDVAFAICGIAFSTFVMNLIGVDETGEMIGEAATMTYACNNAEAAKECRKIREEMTEAQKYSVSTLHKKTGAPLHSAYALPQLRALGAKITTRVFKWQTIASLCLSRWIGVRCLPISYSEASWTGLFDYHSLKWAKEALNHLPETCRAALPEVFDFCDDERLFSGIPEYIDKKNSATRRRNPYWQRWPELRGRTDRSGKSGTYSHCRLFLGIGDGACANIGSKCTNAYRLCVTIGTSAAARICLPYSAPCEATNPLHETVALPSGLFCYRIDKHYVLVGGALTDGGSVIEWVRSLFNLQSDETFEAVMSQIELRYSEEINGTDRSSGPVLIPFLSGERSTGFRDGARGALSGLTRQTTAQDVVKASFEGVILRIRAVLKLMRTTRSSIGQTLPLLKKDCIMASGNGLVQNELWMQLLADSSETEVLVDADTDEATSRGAALLVVSSLDGTAAHSDPETDTLRDEKLYTKLNFVPNVASFSLWAEKEVTQDRMINAIFPLP